VDNIELIAIVELPEAHKVLCQYEDCGRKIYREVHVIRIDGQIVVYGSSCVKKAFGEVPKQSEASILGGRTISLSDPEDIAKLEQNTAELVQEWEERAVHHKQAVVEQHQADDVFEKGMSRDELFAECLAQTKERFRRDRGIDPEAPGWAQWVLSDAEKLFEERFKKGSL